MSSHDPNLPPVLTPDDLHAHDVYVIMPMRRRWWLHILLLLATVFTTLVMGARLQYNFMNDLPPVYIETLSDVFPVMWALRQPSNLLLGIPFALTLLTILLAHEMGHFLYCLRYRVYATLPFFIPAPTLIGTFGAFIRIKSPIPTRRALFDIAVAGPIAGFIVALPAAVIGLLLSKHAAGLVAESEVRFGFPLLFQLLHGIVPWAQSAVPPRIDDLYMHPIAFAAWVGMFATMLNLLPGGQLDGGHLIYSLSPHLHRRITIALVVILLPLAVFVWSGWLIWAIFLLIIVGRHPQVSLYPPLDTKRRMLAVVALIIFLLTFMPAPMVDHSLLDVWLESGQR